MLAPTSTPPQTKILTGNSLALLKTMHANSAHCVVTSPPYFGLRDYGNPDQIGLEPSPQEYVAKLVEVFREVRRVLREDGTCWLNLGDSYARAPTKGGSGPGGKNEDRWGYGEAQAKLASGGAGGVLAPQGERKSRVVDEASKQATNRNADLDAIRGAISFGAAKKKDLLGIPWRVALALQQDGWYLRQDIIWHKPNPMPESVRDRCTKAHEYLFLLTKSERYYFDSDAIAEPSVYAPGKTREVERAKGYCKGKFSEPQAGRNDRSFKAIRETRNKRSVWTVATKPFKEAHFATFPPALIEPCILAGTSEAGCCSNCKSPYVRQVQRTAMQIDRSDRTHEMGRTRSSDTMIAPASTVTTGWKPSCQCNTGHSVPAVVLDPFAGACTTGVVAKQNNRHFVGFELNPEYAAMGGRRIAQTAS